MASVTSTIIIDQADDPEVRFSKRQERPMTLVAAAAAIAAAIVAAYLAGVRHGSIDNDSYWLGFADGELHQQLNDRTPSAN